MEPDDVTDTLNSLLSAGFVETVPVLRTGRHGGNAGDIVRDEPAYVQDMKAALFRR